MTDRVRNPDPGRTPTPQIRNTIEDKRSRNDLEDFAPAFGGGASVGVTISAPNSGANFLLNPAFEDGTNHWTVTVSGFGSDPTLSTTDTEVIEGTTSGIIEYAGGLASADIVADAVALPTGVSYVEFGGKFRYHFVALDPSVQVAVEFFDEDGVAVGDAVLAPAGQMATLVPDTTTEVFGEAAVPDGAFAVQFSFTVVWSNTTVDPTEVFRVDDFFVRAPTVVDGVHTGYGRFELGMAGMDGDEVQPADKASTAVSTVNFEKWSTTGIFGDEDGYITFLKEPSWDGMRLGVSARANGRVGNASGRDADYRIEFSYDGGSTWTSTSMSVRVTGAAGAYQPVGPVHFDKVYGSDVTTSIIARVVFRQRNGVAGDITMREGTFVAELRPVPQ